MINKLRQHPSPTGRRLRGNRSLESVFAPRAAGVMLWISWWSVGGLWSPSQGYSC